LALDPAVHPKFCFPPLVWFPGIGVDPEVHLVDPAVHPKFCFPPLVWFTGIDVDPEGKSVRKAQSENKISSCRVPLTCTTRREHPLHCIEKEGRTRRGRKEFHVRVKQTTREHPIGKKNNECAEEEGRTRRGRKEFRVRVKQTTREHPTCIGKKNNECAEDERSPSLLVVSL
jgi:hypothetical protein